MPFPHARPGRLGGGIGLLLMMIVILIGMSMYFGSFGGKSYMQTTAAVKKKAAEDIRDFSTAKFLEAIVAHKLSQDKLPQSFDELGAVLADPWGHPVAFSYRTEKAEAGGEVTYVIWRSAGPDGAMNTPDDVVKTDRLPV